MQELEERARLFGDPVKQSAQAKVLERKWLRFLTVYGDEYGFDESVGPDVDVVRHFVTSMTRWVPSRSRVRQRQQLW